MHPQRRRLRQREERTKLSGRPLFLVKQRPTPHQQWRDHDKRNHHKSGHVIGGGSRTGSTIFECKRGSIPTTNTHRNGSPATADATPNRQHAAEGVINNKIQPKRTKAMDMRFHWLRDREAQGQFRIYWRPGKTNLADYFTKHHPPAHHVNVRTEFLTKVKDLAEDRCQRRNKGQTKSHLSQSKQLQGCAKLPNRDSRAGSSHSLATSKLVMENILNSPPRGRFSNEVSK